MATTSLPHTGFGTLGFTWRPQRVPDEQAFPCFKAAIDNGATIFSTASGYGMAPDPPTAGLLLLSRFFKEYPEYAAKVTLFVRGCFDSVNFKTDCTREGVRASWAEVNGIFEGIKRVDVFGPARMDQENVPLEETIGALKELVDEGKIGGVGLSEVRAETITRASAICPILYSEVEFSMWTTEMLDNGVAKAAKECNVALLAYAPLGYGFLTSDIRNVDEIPEGDGRRRLARFQPENFAKNLALANKLKAIAASMSITPAQLALAWIRAHSNTGECGVVIPIPGATKVDKVNDNCKHVELSAEQKLEIDQFLASSEVAGGRAWKGSERFVLT